MIEPPADLSDQAIVAALEVWDIFPVELEYAPLGFGSHHWIAMDAAGDRKFVTLDTGQTGVGVATRRFARLSTAMLTARALADLGLEFVVAPLLTRGGSVLGEVQGRYAMTVFPFVPGQGFEWGDRLPPELESELIGDLTRLHQPGLNLAIAPPSDEFRVPNRIVLEHVVLGGDGPPEVGPYTKPMARLIIAAAPDLLAVLDRYDAMAGRARSSPHSAVVTHGEPHEGNTIASASGLRLVDWDTTLLAPRERDLWMLDQGNPRAMAAYEEAAGVRVEPELLELYRARWDLADLAAFVAQFAGPHDGDANDEASWGWLEALVGNLVTTARPDDGP